MGRKMDLVAPCIQCSFNFSYQEKSSLLFSSLSLPPSSFFHFCSSSPSSSRFSILNLMEDNCMDYHCLGQRLLPGPIPVHKERRDGAPWLARPGSRVQLFSQGHQKLHGRQLYQHPTISRGYWREITFSTRPLTNEKAQCPGWGNPIYWPTISMVPEELRASTIWDPLRHTSAPTKSNSTPGLGP